MPFWGAKEPKKGTLFLKGSQEGPWEGLGSDFSVDLGGILDVVLDKFSMIFFLCSSSVFDIGDV